MEILTYKRTHTGDPDKNGVFGVNDCMGSVRNRLFDAVIGIGSLKPWPDFEEIAGKVTWVGINPIPEEKPDFRGNILKFEKFVLFDEKGFDFREIAPNLAKRFYEKNARVILRSYSRVEKQEAMSVIDTALRSQDSLTKNGNFDNFNRKNIVCRSLTKRTICRSLTKHTKCRRKFLNI